MADGFKERYDEHMAGRNGADAISRTCLVVALVLVLLSFAFVGISPFLYLLVLLLGIASAVYAALRMNSRDVARRRLENEAFLSRFRRLGARGQRREEPARRPRRPQTPRDDAARNDAPANPEPKAAPEGQAPEKVVIACENCGQRLRVPAGKGAIRITCPKCSTKFTARS